MEQLGVIILMAVMAATVAIAREQLEFCLWIAGEFVWGVLGLDPQR